MKVFILSLTIIVLVCWMANMPPRTEYVERYRVDTVKVDSTIPKFQKRVAVIESRNNPKAKRFEPVIFRRLTSKSASNFADAKRINYRAAHLATSWGKYQILGINYRVAGFATLEALIRATPKQQDVGFITYCKNRKLIPYMQRREFSAFARAYNGPGFRHNDYDNKLIAGIK